MRTGELLIKFAGDTRGFLTASNKVKSETKSIGRGLVEIGSLWKIAAGTGAGLALGAGVRAVAANTIEAENAMAQLQARVKSTGGAAGRTVPQLAALAQGLQKTTTFSDEATEGAESLLLTFKRIKGENFDAATVAVLDLAQALAAGNGGVPDLRSAALQVGKALEDPATQMTMLRRSGVSFTQSQIDLAKKLQATGKLAEAQAIILKELNSQFGGAAAAARNTLGGALKYLSNQWGDALEMSSSSSAGIVAAINAIGDAVPGVRAKLDDFFATLNLSKALQNEFTAGIQDLSLEELEQKAQRLEASIRHLNDYLPETMKLGIFETTETDAVAASLVALDFALAAVVERIKSMPRDAADATPPSPEALLGVKDMLSTVQTQVSLFQAGLDKGWELPHLQQIFHDLVPLIEDAREKAADIQLPAVSEAQLRKVEALINEWASSPRSTLQAAASFSAISRVLAENGASVEDLTGKWAELVAIIREAAGIQPPAAPESGSFFDRLEGQAKDIFNVEDIVSTAFGNLLSGGLQTAFSFIGNQIASLFSENPYEAERNRLIKENSERLRNLAANIEKLDFGAVTGTSGIGAAQQAVQAYLAQPGAGDYSKSGWSTLAVFLRQFGLTFDELVAIGKTFGVTIDGSVESLQQFTKALSTDWLKNVSSTFSGGWDLLQRQLQLLDITDPTEQFRLQLDFMASHVSKSFGDLLRSLDATNFDQFISDFLDRLAAGDQSILAQLGNEVSIQDFLNFLGSAEGALDGLATSASDVTEALRNVPSGFKVRLARFRATTAATLGGVEISPKTGTKNKDLASGGVTTAAISALEEIAKAAGGQTFNIYGDVVVPGVKDPKSLLSGLEEQAQWKARTGGASVIPVTTRRTT